MSKYRTANWSRRLEYPHVMFLPTAPVAARSLRWPTVSSGGQAYLQEPTAEKTMRTVALISAQSLWLQDLFIQGSCFQAETETETGSFRTKTAKWSKYWLRNFSDCWYKSNISLRGWRKSSPHCCPYQLFQLIGILGGKKNYASDIIFCVQTETETLSEPSELYK